MKTSKLANSTRVVVVAWDQMDLTDFTGPLEVLSHARNDDQERLVETIIAAATEITKTSQNVGITRDVDISTILSELDSFDVLIIPGGGGFTVEQIPAAPGVREVLNSWAKLPARVDKPRVIMSICAGAWFLADAGLLVGKTATTHYAYLAGLREVGQRHGKLNVVRQHYVDAGTDAEGPHIITSGGIVSGIDSTFYLLELIYGPEVAEAARAIMDANWRKEMTPFGFA